MADMGATAMAAHACDAVERVRGLQQGLEASLLQQKEELARVLGARIEHVAQEAADAAFGRAVALLLPRCEALEVRLEEQVEASQAAADAARAGLADLAEQHATARKDITALRMEAHKAKSLIDDLHADLLQEGRNREARCGELAATAAELAAVAAEESRRRAAAAARAEEALGCAGAAAAEAEAAREATERLDRALADLSQDVAARDHQQATRLEERTTSCLEEAGCRTAEAEARLLGFLRAAAEEAAQQAAELRSHSEGLVQGAMVTLRDEQEAAGRRLLVAAEGAAGEQTDAVANQLRSELASAGRTAETEVAEVMAKVWEALARLEGRVSDERAGHLAELQTLAKGHSVRVNFLSSAVVGKRQLEEQQQGGRPELHHLSLKARGEAVLRAELQEFRSAVGDLEARLTRDVDVLRSEVGGRASSQECYTRLQAIAADLSARIHRLRSDTDEARERTQREMLALSNEVTTLRAGATSLTDGVVKALQALGLLDVIAPVAAAPGSPNQPDNGIASASPRAAGHPGAMAGPVRPLRQKSGASGGRVRIEDLLQWEKAGQSLATRVMSAKAARANPPSRPPEGERGLGGTAGADPDMLA